MESKNKLDLFDTHFHLEADDDLAAIVAAAEAVGVSRMLMAGTDIPRLPATLELLEDFPRVHAAAGVHPHEAESFDDNVARYRELASQEQVRAVGEIGLDYFYNNSPRKRQRQVFGAFLDLARETGLPAIIHCREADEDCHAMLRDRLAGGHPFVIHCFTSTPAWAERYLELGGHLSFTGILTFGKADNVRDSLAVVPRERLMVETDSPYLAPKPHRGKRNQPAYLPHIVRFAADFLGCDAETLASETTANARRFFKV